MSKSSYNSLSWFSEFAYPELTLIRGREPRHNNGMHPTADTTVVIEIKGAARRVMRGVMLLERFKRTRITLNVLIR